MKKFILAFTGASGSILGLNILRELVKSSHVYVVASPNAVPIIRDETGIDLEDNPEKILEKCAQSDNITFFEDSNLYAPISSGSFRTDGMIIAPCSVKTLGSIANGIAGNLIGRCADVTIKEGRRLLLSPREMPFSTIHLENMLKLSRLGAIIAPPVPAFYHKPESLDDMLHFFTGKILDSMGVDNELFKRWADG